MRKTIATNDHVAGIVFIYSRLPVVASIGTYAEWIRSRIYIFVNYSISDVIDPDLDRVANIVPRLPRVPFQVADVIFAQVEPERVSRRRSHINL